MENRVLSRDSSREERRGTREALFDSFAELLFDRVNLISAGGAVSGDTTDTSAFITGMRVTDTSEGRKFMSPNRSMRFRCGFYVSGGVEKAEFYILSPLVTSTSIISGPTNMKISDGFVGIHCDAGVLTLESWDGSELMTRHVGTLSGTTT